MHLEILLSVNRNLYGSICSNVPGIYQIEICNVILQSRFVITKYTGGIKFATDKIKTQLLHDSLRKVVGNVQVYYEIIRYIINNFIHLNIPLY